MADLYPADPLSARLAHQAAHDVIFSIGTELYVAVLATIEHTDAPEAAADVLKLRDRLVKLATEKPLNRPAMRVSGGMCDSV
jgi:hypothetical protein